MLRTFIYLDSEVLHELIGVMEDGLNSGHSFETSGGNSVGGGAKLGAFHAEGTHNGTSKKISEFGDTDPAKFSRFIEYCKQHPDESGWTSVTDSASAVSVEEGSIVEIKVDTYVPDMVKYFTHHDQVSNILSAIKQFPGDIPGVDPDEVRSVIEKNDQLESFVNIADGKSLICGEALDMAMKIVGKIDPKFVIRDDELEGERYNVVGKLRSSWGREEWKNIISLPGMNFIPRQQRRALQKTKPNDDNKDQWLEGPAMQLQIVAIYV